MVDLPKGMEYSSFSDFTVALNSPFNYIFLSFPFNEWLLPSPIPLRYCSGLILLWICLFATSWWLPRSQVRRYENIRLRHLFSLHVNTTDTSGHALQRVRSDCCQSWRRTYAGGLWKPSVIHSHNFLRTFLIQDLLLTKTTWTAQGLLSEPFFLKQRLRFIHMLHPSRRDNYWTDPRFCVSLS